MINDMKIFTQGAVGLAALGIGSGLPLIAMAQEAAVAEARNFVATFNEVILFPTIGLLSAVALLVFIYGCFQYIALSGNDQARAQGVKHITWGIVGLVVMLSAYTILSIVAGTFGLQDELDTANEGEVVVPLPDGAAGRGENADDGNAGRGE